MTIYTECCLSIRGYNTFNGEYRPVFESRCSDEGGIQFNAGDSMYNMSQYINKHPTQSFFSLYNMEYNHRLKRAAGASPMVRNSSAGSSVTSNPINEAIYSVCGTWYRNCCFTDAGMKAMLVVNISLVLLNLFLIIYQVIIVWNEGFYYYIHAKQAKPLPIIFFVCDLVITVVLIIEVTLHWSIGYLCSCQQYLCFSTWDNKVDLVVMILSVLCCIFYATDFEGSSDIEEFIFLAIRIMRDIIRILRCYFFFKLLRGNMTFDFSGICGIDEESNPNMSTPKLMKLKSKKSQFLWDQYLKKGDSKRVSSIMRVNQDSLPRIDQEIEFSDSFSTSESKQLTMSNEKYNSIMRTPLVS